MSVRVDVLGSGSRGNCTLVQAGRTRLLIDAGLSRREVARRLDTVGVAVDDLDAVLLTHAHGDHVRGVPVLCRRHAVPVVAHEDTFREAGLEDESLPEWLALEPGRPMILGDVTVEPFMVPHDAETTVGFRLESEGVAVGYCTDLGHVTALVRQRLSDLDVLVLESNHDLEMLRDGPYPWSLKQRVGGRHGHLSNEASAELLADVLGPRLRHVALAHLSETNNEPELALAHAREVLRRGGRDDVILVAASQDRPCHVAQA